MAVMDHKFFIKERYMSKGKLNLTLLAPAMNQFIRRIGFYDKETCCKVFEFCVELIRDDLVEAKGVALKNASPKAKAKAVLPDGKGHMVFKRNQYMESPDCACSIYCALVFPC